MKKEVEAALAILPHFMALGREHMGVDYDAEADVLYLSFERPVPAEDADMPQEDVIVRYAGDRIVGVTILGARDKLKVPPEPYGEGNGGEANRT